jgi:hypothetical protein
MLEIPPLSPAVSMIKLEKIKKNEHLSEQPQHKKKQASEDQETQAIQHIDEIV